MKIWEFKDKLYQEVEAGPWLALVQVETKKAKSISQRWTGHRIPMSLWQQITSFFEWSQETTRSEAMVHLFYDDVLGWDCCVLPQKGHQGMTVQLLEDHPNRQVAFQLMGGRREMGTVHHHCGASAFQSSGDKDDEVSKEGLHITVGHIGCNEYSIHARATKTWGIFAGLSPAESDQLFAEIEAGQHKNLKAHEKCTTLDVHLEDWFEVSDEVAALVPKKLHGELLEAILCDPVKVPFPDWWQDNVIKVERPVVTYQQGTLHSSSRWDAKTQSYVPYHSGYSEVEAWRRSTGQGSQLPEHYQQVGFSQSPAPAAKPKFSEELPKVMQDWGLNVTDVEAMFDSLASDGGSAVIDAMVECGVDCKAAEAVVMYMPTAADTALLSGEAEIDALEKEWMKRLEDEGHGVIGG